MKLLNTKEKSSIGKDILKHYHPPKSVYVCMYVGIHMYFCTNINIYVCICIHVYDIHIIYSQVKC